MKCLKFSVSAFFIISLSISPDDSKQKVDNKPVTFDPCTANHRDTLKSVGIKLA